MTFCAFVAVAQAGLISHGPAYAAGPAHYAAGPAHYAAAPAHYAAAPVAYSAGPVAGSFQSIVSFPSVSF